MSLTTKQQELYDIGRGTLPEWYTSDERANEFLSAIAKIFSLSRDVAERWLGEVVLIANASADVGEPDWLDQHARDRGTYRQASESDAVLIDRIRNIPDAVTLPALLSAIQAMMTAGGFSGTPDIVELPRDRAHFGDYTEEGGSGVCVLTAGVAVDEIDFLPPDGKFLAAPIRATPRTYGADLTLGTGGGPNDGTFPVFGILGDAAQLSITGGSAETTAPDSVWGIRKKDADGNYTDGFARAYLGRGYLMGACPPSRIIVILPYGTTENFASAVREMLRQKKAAGVAATVQWRQNP